ncbi:MAG TPA: F0F1 ATP synthase subunit epsilon [Elusimicrobia bacterium]|nr:F0F1 ATP synthase subunit epsilon [Elusimicrobiota bacterium]HBT62722.1 F0F1 ATP synthase subunit epsilon [Elusimicrobiota bacterium]
MSGQLTLEVVTPERLAFSGGVDFVVLPAWEGEMGVLPGHAPFLVQLQPGEVRFRDRGEMRRFAVSGGFAEIKEDKVALFAETAEMAEQIDAERARQALERARGKLRGKELDPMTLAQAEASLQRARLRLKIAGLRKGGRRGP